MASLPMQAGWLKLALPKWVSEGFHFDNEVPAHPVYLAPYAAGQPFGDLRGVSGVYGRWRLPQPITLAERWLGLGEGDGD